MKVIKRDGRAVDYDRQKIKIAIEKANGEVSRKEKATKEVKEDKTSKATKEDTKEQKD